MGGVTRPVNQVPSKGESRTRRTGDQSSESAAVAAGQESEVVPDTEIQGTPTQLYLDGSQGVKLSFESDYSKHSKPGSGATKNHSCFELRF
ncbi:hypothetical protein chiPu_0006601 [Chiloscyllium punctatum]|uniref:Uncharacterized protein n=1 Tax=Chiloscyllium punctatum TaxID=137246 RepID=A0A401SCU9_CHIPU|nr:hypothetical protein [Chiloscyllium punctatum]